MGPLRKVIYAAKQALQDNPDIYHGLYSAATFNRDKARLLIERDKYPSKFGGMWTDRDDFEDELQRRAPASDLIGPLRQWRDDGYVIFPGAIDRTAIDRYTARLDSLEQSAPPRLQVTSAASPAGTLYTNQKLEAHKSQRIVDCYHFFEETRDLLFAPQIERFLEYVFDAPMVLTQSLNFKFGSEQSFHADTSFVIMTSPVKFGAAWIALEDVRPGAGALTYLPGSHRWGDFLFNKRFKHWDEGIAGSGEEMRRWHEWREAKMKETNTEPAFFHAKKGDVLLWHGGLIHGGSSIDDPALTRRSIVGHYCPSHVRPLYHYYKPSQRKIYRDGARRYTTSYY